MSPRTDSPLIEPDVIARVLAKGRSTGAEFSEIYVEDKRSTSAGLDDGKVEQVTSGRDRGAGIRVIAGDTTGFAHTSDLSERGLLAAAEAAAAAAKQPAAVTASLVHHGKSLNEVLAQKLEMHKRRMFESALSQGTASVFVK